MQYRVGQRVRLLHHSGEAVIVALVDKNLVEVDLGDDFPIEVHVNEIVPIDQKEDKYLQKNPGQSAPPPPPQPKISKLGRTLFELSLAVTQDEDGFYEFTLINPENQTILYNTYIKMANKYQGMACGQVSYGAMNTLMSLPSTQIGQLKGIYFQLLSFVEGKGHPAPPYITEIPWSKGRLLEKMKHIEALDQSGWLFSLRQEETVLEQSVKSSFISLKGSDKKLRIEKIVDLHIEELVSDPHQMDPTDMLKTQILHASKAISNALVENYNTLILIHGLGNGTLRKEIHKLLKISKNVERFETADPKRFGQGATIAYLR